jgi:hypothetical protein
LSNIRVSDRARGRFRHTAVALVSFLCFQQASCHAQNREVLCSNGSGNFEAEFHTGVKVRVGAARKAGEGLATRFCGATLGWPSQETIVATEASQLDVDVFGADLGFGLPVVAFQVKNSNTECCMAYQIYSLQNPPRLLRAITGGDFFSAADTDLDGRVEIWTDDAAAVDGVENLGLSELDFPPTIVLRFEGNRLLDVSSEFRPYFDQEIAKLRAGLDLQGLRDFKNSNGKLASTDALSAEQLHNLRRVKMKVLEMVWSYLYSGRESEAWSSLADMWPLPDAERIRAALLNARARGIRTQVDGVSSEVATGRHKRSRVFDTMGRSGPSKSDVTPPEPIMLRRPSPPDAPARTSEVLLDLLIDSAGKVRSVEPAGKIKSVDTGLIGAAMQWKFIPAFAGGRAVASRLRFAVSAKQ